MPYNCIALYGFQCSLILMVVSDHQKSVRKLKFREVGSQSWSMVEAALEPRFTVY